MSHVLCPQDAFLCSLTPLCDVFHRCRKNFSFLSRCGFLSLLCVRCRVNFCPIRFSYDRFCHRMSFRVCRARFVCACRLG